MNHTQAQNDRSRVQSKLFQDTENLDMRKNSLVVVISTLLVGAATQAQPADTPQPASDASHSKVAMTGEAGSKAKEKWTAADSDRNGSLSQAEFQAAMPTAAANFSQMDANGDGEVSLDEMHAYKVGHKSKKWRQSFDAADKDGDGSLSLAEAQGGMPKIAGQFAAIDANSDSKVTYDELKTHRKAHRDESRDASQTLNHSKEPTGE